MFRLTSIVLLLLSVGVGWRQQVAEAYTVTAGSSATTELTPLHMAMNGGHGHEDSNAFMWYEYLGVTATRLFVSSITDWPTFIRRYIAVNNVDQFGRDFQGVMVTDRTKWLAAVNHLRTARGGTNFFTWLTTSPRTDITDWQILIDRLTTTQSDSTLNRALGNSDNTISELGARGISILAQWSVTCSNFDPDWVFTSTSTSQDFWRQFWEMYRWFYIGGQFLASRNVDFVALYNEPNIKDCEAADVYLHNFRVRSQAIQEAYADAGKSKPTIVVPPQAGGSNNLYMEASAKYPHDTFTNGYNANFLSADHYAYHAYDYSKGSSMVNSYDRVKGNLTLFGRSDMNVYTTEFNCYTASNSETKAGDTIDTGATAACVANRVAFALGRHRQLYLFKLTQTHTYDTDSTVKKNGILWGSNDVYPFHISGSSKGAEAYRLLLRKITGEKALWSLSGATGSTNLFKAFMVSDSVAHYFYSINEETVSLSQSFRFANVPGVPASSPIVISAVSTNYHGEVSAIGNLASDKSYSFTQPAGSVYMFTIPKTAVTRAEIVASADTTVRAGTNKNTAYGSDTTLLVSTQTTDHANTAVSLLKFDVSGYQSNAVSVVLQLRIQASSASSNQVLTVFGVGTSWSETTSWSGVNQLETDLTTTIDSSDNNFINWASPDLKIVGHVTIPGSSAAGKYVYLDVTDYVKAAGTTKAFMIARMFRFNKRGPASGAPLSAALAADAPSGTYTFYSRQASTATDRPRLVALSGGCANTCSAGQYRKADCTCASCTVCNGGNFTRTACTATADTVCQSCTVCPQGQYASPACGGTTDATCRTCTTCSSGQYASTLCGGSQNAVCSTCSACSAGQYLQAACTSTSNTQCATCSTCPVVQGTSFLKSACTSTNNTVCGSCLIANCPINSTYNSTLCGNNVANPDETGGDSGCILNCSPLASTCPTSNTISTCCAGSAYCSSNKCVACVATGSSCSSTRPYQCCSGKCTSKKKCA